jgi:fido (protein-threonine AMPylation protein)
VGGSVGGRREPTGDLGDSAATALRAVSRRRQGSPGSWCVFAEASAARPTVPCDEPEPRRTVPGIPRRLAVVVFLRARTHPGGNLGHQHRPAGPAAREARARREVPTDRDVPELLCSWHREIFGEIFPEEAGRLRGRHEGEWEHVQYGGYVGTRRSRRIRVYRGAHPRRLHRRLEKICNEFNTAATEIRASPYTDSFDAVHAATRLYAKVLRAHPFIDGNLRAGIAALNAGLVMFGLDIVTFKDLERHDELLAIAFVGKHDPYRPLAQHIEEIIRDSESA